MEERLVKGSRGEETDGFIRIQLPQVRVLLHKHSLWQSLASGDEEGPRAELKVWT